MAVVIGGLAQLVLGIARAGIIGKYFPSSVIQGMLAAIGIIIFIKQIPHGLGYAGAEGTIKADKVFDVLLLLGDNLAYAAPTAMTVTAVCLVILVLWETSFMKAMSFTKVLSGSLVAVLAGVVVHLITMSGALAAAALGRAVLHLAARHRHAAFEAQHRHDIAPPGALQALVTARIWEPPELG